MPDRRGAHDSAADTTLANGPKGRFEPGQRIGPYEIVRSLGKGAMGTVVVARHTDLGREVALKVLSHAAAVDAESVERFRRESEATARLKHANIVGMYERGEADGFHYYAMELISGVSLEDVMKRERVSYIEAARIMSQIAHAIDYAHGQGVLHRDLKPANILLDDSGRPRVTDFGLARMNQKATLTSDGIVVGTPLYLAPEVARGGRGSRQSDIYSLGATLYELASGKPPYPGLDARTVLLRVLAEPPAAPTVVDPRMPADLVRVIAKAMARDPAERYANARQLAVDLDRFVQGRALEIGGSAEAWKERPAARHARSAGLLVLSLAALACVIALFVDERAKRRALEREKKEREAKLRTRPPEDHGLTDKDAVGVRALEVRDDRARAALASLPDDAADPLARGLFDERLSRAHEAAADNPSLAAAKLREALQLFPHRWDVRLELARAVAASEPEETEKELSIVVLSQAPRDVAQGARLERARFYRSRGDRLASWLAAADYRSLLGSSGPDPSLRSSIGADLALVSAELGDFATARKTLEDLPNLAGDDLARASLARASIARAANDRATVDAELAQARSAAVSDEVKKAVESFSR